MDSITILGGGPAGLATAYYAHRSGLDFTLYEKSGSPGGLCRTFRCGEHLYDSGAHRFHDRDPEVTRDLRSLLGQELIRVSAPSKVYISGRFLSFPPTPLNLFQNTGLNQLSKIGIDFLMGRVSRREIVSFQDFAVKNFGHTLAEQFLLNYSEKVWGLPSERLSPAVATRRLSGMSLRSLVTELILPNRKTTHIDGQFLYPEGGYGRIMEALAGSLPADRLMTHSEITGLQCQNGHITGLRVGQNREFTPVQGTIVSTLPLPLVVHFLQKHLSPEIVARSKKLAFRNIRLLFLRLPLKRFSENASIYIPDRGICMTRIYEPKNRSEAMAPHNETSLVVEVPCFSGDSVSSLSNEELVQRIIRDLEILGLLERTPILQWQHHFLPNAYPCYSLDFEESVQAILNALDSFKNLTLLGRNGLFYYSHLHHQLRFGKDYTEQLVENRVCS